MASISWNDSFLDRMRASGDPLADKVIADFVSAGRIDNLNELMGNLHGAMAAMGKGAESDSVQSGMPASLKAFLDESAALPPWTDAAKIKRAQNIFTLHGPMFGIVMLFKSLPILYAGGQGGAQVLTMTGQLTNHYRRRAAETLRFILDVMEPGGLDAGDTTTPMGRGIATAQKVRLMHAAIRTYAGESAEWKKHAAWGRPINQEELAGTLLAFSTVTLDGLSALGLRLPEADAEAYFHAWKVVGHVIGVDEQLIPGNLKDAADLWAAMSRRNFFRTDAGLLLIHDHQKFLDELVPGILLRGGVPSLLRYLMGRKISNAVFDLPKSSAPFALLLFLMEFLRLQKWGFRLFPGLAKAARGISVRLMEALQSYLKVGHSKPFRIPGNIHQR